MTKSVKLRHIAVIVTVIIVAIGMAVGTICHFLAGGFFNYGDEFASYKSVEVTTSVPEDPSGETLQTIASEELSSLGAYEVSFSRGTGYVPHTVVYKFYTSVNDAAISDAVSAIQSRFSQAGFEDSYVTSHVNDGVAEGVWQLNYVAIALASAAVFQAIYFAIRFKPGMALSALLTQLAAAGLYASLLAITRCPVGLEAIAFAAVAAIIAMICNGIFFDRVKKSFKDEANAKAQTLGLVSEGARSTFKISAFACIAALAAVVIFGVFAVIASPALATLAPFAACALAVVACAYSVGMFTPASYSLVCGMDRRAK